MTTKDNEKETPLMQQVEKQISEMNTATEFDKEKIATLERIDSFDKMKAEFAKFKDKIIYILIDKLPDGLHEVDKINDLAEKGNRTIDNALMIEHNQRNSILNGLNNAEENDLIIVSDVDEIPNLEDNNLRKINKKLIHFKQTMYYYKFNLKYDSKKDWYGSKACLKKNLILPQWLRDTKEKKYPIWRLDILFSKMKY